ncbi:sugar phosphate isomerase/epimerase [Rhizobiaceae bacterium BDR2-2]|uniref:Sugar phosphate isomerase/epimerase n=1 Tax=Ectorhizobium quercum TaxID=2965071 RepID=A0AAE3SX70_9HYPH|nr:sugar phosphate isomerase/epimerase [Ectorhizobium quercum]MCX8998170.1 sugar phosphate isomerase/epimerase [Ectorhizobium quercum]
MTRKLSLSFLTCLGAPPEEAVRVAAETGYDYLGLRLLPAAPGGIAFPLMEEPARMRDLGRLLNDEGVDIFDVEMIRIGPHFDASAFLPFLDCAAHLGARVILVTGDDPDEARLTASFAALCDTAADFGLSADLEFMPQSRLPDLAAAMRVLNAADRPNQGVIVDALHVSRSRTPVEEIASIPRPWLHYAQICDGPADIPENVDELNFAARHARLVPGDGAIDLGAIFAALPADLPVAVEVPNDRLSAGLTPAEWAGRTRQASLSVLEAAIAGDGR